MPRALMQPTADFRSGLFDSLAGTRSAASLRPSPLGAADFENCRSLSAPTQPMPTRFFAGQSQPKEMPVGLAEVKEVWPNQLHVPSRAMVQCGSTRLFLPKLLAPEPSGHLAGGACAIASRDTDCPLRSGA